MGGLNEPCHCGMLFYHLTKRGFHSVVPLGSAIRLHCVCVFLFVLAEVLLADFVAGAGFGELLVAHVVAGAALAEILFVGRSRWCNRYVSFGLLASRVRNRTFSVQDELSCQPHHFANLMLCFWGMSRTKSCFFLCNTHFSWQAQHFANLKGMIWSFDLFLLQFDLFFWVIFF